MPALVVFERVVSGALKNGVAPTGTLLRGIDEEEFNMLQTLHLETLNELTGVNRRMEVKHRSLVEKILLEEINELKICRNKSLIACSLCYFVCYFKKMDNIYYQPNHLWKGQKLLRSYKNTAKKNLR